MSDALYSRNWTKIRFHLKNLLTKFKSGSNIDEVKLWLATAEYFVKLDYSAVGNM